TRLMYPPVTNRLPLAETEKLLEETAVKNRHDAATLADTEVVGKETRKGERTKAAEAGRTEAFKARRAEASRAVGAEAVKGEAPTAPGGARTPAPARPVEKSVVTRVGVNGDAGAARKGSRRAVVAALCVVAVALVAAAVYSLAYRQPRVDADAHGPVAGQPTPQAQPVESQTPPDAATPAPADGVKSAAGAPSNEPAHAPAQPRHAADAADKNAAPREQNQNRPAEERVPPAPTPLAPPERAGQAEEEPFRDRDWARNPPSDEEIRLWIQQHPGWLEQHPNRARMLRRRLMQDQRRRRNNQPPP